MGTLYLVRHGQASFGADDYDQLSELGQRQSVRLGEYFAERGIHFEGLIAGTLRRHQQTLQGILQGMQCAGEPLAWDGLNEYDSQAVIATVHPEPLQKPTSPEAVRHHFRLLRDGLSGWMAGSSTRDAESGSTTAAAPTSFICMSRCALTTLERALT